MLIISTTTVDCSHRNDRNVLCEFRLFHYIKWRSYRKDNEDRLFQNSFLMLMHQLG